MFQQWMLKLIWVEHHSVNIDSWSVYGGKNMASKSDINNVKTF